MNDHGGNSRGSPGTGNGNVRTALDDRLEALAELLKDARADMDPHLAEQAHKLAHRLVERAEERGDQHDIAQASRLLKLTGDLLERLGVEHGGGGMDMGGEPEGSLAMAVAGAQAPMVRGDSGPNVLQGTDAAERMSGKAGDDTLSGGAGNDSLWGNLGNDLLDGGAGDDMLTGSFGADTLRGGDGDDVLLSRADAGEPEIARPDDGRSERITDSLGFTFRPDSLPHNDVLTGGAGADTFWFETTIGTKPRQMLGEGDVPLRPDGDINWSGIAMGKNGTPHYHWADSIGDDVITDFNRAEGDRIQLMGHTLDVLRIEHVGADSVIHLVSRSTNPDARQLAHEDDDLGSITVLNAHVTMDDISIEKMPVFGNLVKPGDTTDLRRVPFQLDDTGVLPGLGLPGEDPWMM